MLTAAISGSLFSEGIELVLYRLQSKEHVGHLPRGHRHLGEKVKDKTRVS